MIKKYLLEILNIHNLIMTLLLVLKKMIMIFTKLVATLEVMKHLTYGQKQEQVKKLMVYLVGLKKEKHGQLDILAMVLNSNQDKAARPSNIAGVIAQMKWGVIGNLGEQRMKDVVLEAIKYREGKESGSASQAQQDRQVSDAVEKGLREKVEKHNEEVNNAASKRTTYRTLLTVFERGIGAYKTNPASVRPNVSSPEQWAYARVNSFLFALRNGRFQGGKHDTDLLPESHPLSSKEEKAMKDKEDRHILNVNETDDSVIIEFAKHHEDEEEEMEMTDSERPYHDEDEEKDRKRIKKIARY